MEDEEGYTALNLRLPASDITDGYLSNKKCPTFSTPANCVTVDRVSASSAIRQPATLAFFALSLVLLTGLVVLLSLCKYCGVPRYRCGNDLLPSVQLLCLFMLTIPPNTCGNNITRMEKSLLHCASAHVTWNDFVFQTYKDPEEGKKLQAMREALCFERRANNETECALCPARWKSSEAGSCFYVSKQKKTWKESQEFCSTRNSTLLVLKDKVKMVSLPYDSQFYWVGLSYISERNGWFWEDGTALSTEAKTCAVMKEHGDDHICYRAINRLYYASTPSVPPYMDRLFMPVTPVRQSNPGSVRKELSNLPEEAL